MVLRAAQDVSALIAKKSYAKAIELIKEQLKTQRTDPRLRMQLADVLVLAGKGKEAVMILTPLADEFAREGFAAKAIAVLKRIQKIDPSRREVEAKLASLIQEKQQQATAPPVPPTPAPTFEIGMEEIGFEPPPGGPIAVPIEDRKASLPPPGPEIGFDVEPVPESEPPAKPPVPVEPTLTPQVPLVTAGPDLMIEEAGIELEADPEPVPTVLPEPAADPPAEPERPVIILEPVAEPAVLVEPEPMAPAASAAEPEFVLDDEEGFELDAAGEPGAGEEEMSAEPVSVEGEPITDGLFVDELMSVLEEAFPSGLEAPFTEPIAPQSSGAAQIVVSPLFRHFSVDEMVAVIAGLHLVSYERGQVIIREGEAGNSLFMLSSG
jgi:hypothetical protein